MFAGALVATYITLEAPLSGMSMNPARTFGPAILTHTARSLWIYFTAPLLGMLLAAEFYVRIHGRAHVKCAKLHHPFDVRCIFTCGYSICGHAAGEHVRNQRVGAGPHADQETRVPA